jgi:hypothetical protein
MVQYAGDPNAFPVDYTIMDSGTEPGPTEMNVGLEALGDRTMFLATKGLRVEVFDITASGVWNAPATAAAIAFAEGCGGAGGAGGGRNFVGGDINTSGGGGGGGALKRLQPIVIVPGGAHAVTIGNGGDGGAAGVSGVNGADTVLLDPTAVELLRFRGAQGGAAGLTNGDGPTSYQLSKGGGPNAAQLPWSLTPSNDPGAHPMEAIAGHGGHGSSGGNAVASRRDGSVQGVFYGGTAGLPSLTSAGTYRGGGAGGGGGAGAYGAGGNGGNGGAGNNVGAAGNGTAGQAGAPNTGAGGGGGGSSGGSTTSGSGGVGGAGGSGRLRIYVLLSRLDP